MSIIELTKAVLFFAMATGVVSDLVSVTSQVSQLHDKQRDLSTDMERISAEVSLLKYSEVKDAKPIDEEFVSSHAVASPGVCALHCDEEQSCTGFNLVTSLVGHTCKLFSRGNRTATCMKKANHITYYFKSSRASVASLYFPVSKKMDWEDAWSYCIKAHPRAHLVSIDSPEENQIISKLASQFPADLCQWSEDNSAIWVWTGGVHEGGAWKWLPSNQKAVHEAWASGEPDGGSQNRLCVLVSGENQEMLWYDGKGKYNMCFLCELDL